MDSIWAIVGRTVVYVLIFTLVYVVNAKVSLSGHVSQSDEKSMIIDKKGISNIFFGTGILFAVIVFICNLFPSNILGIRKIIIDCIILLFCVFQCALSIVYRLWGIKLSEREILVRNYIGKKEVISIKDFDTFERQSNGNVVLYTADGKGLEIPSEHTSTVLEWVIDRVHIKGSQENNKEKFVVRPAKYHRVLGIIIIVTFFAFLVLSICGRYMWGISVFALLSIFGIGICCSQFIEKYCIGNGRIEYHSFLKKNKVVLYSDISKIEFRQGDNVSYYYVYGKLSDKPIFKMNTYYENFFFFKDLAYNMNWLK